MPIAVRRSGRQGANFWPGFVDGLAGLLMVVVFLVMVFALAQLFLSEALSGRDVALQRLSRQVDDLANLLSLEREANADLRLSVAQLSAELQTSLAERERLVPQVASLADERDLLLSEREALQQKLAALEADLAAEIEARESAGAEADKVQAELEDAFKVIAADKETIDLQLRELESLRRDVDALKVVREDLEVQVTELALTLDTNRQKLTEAVDRGDRLDTELTQIRDRTKELEARLASEEERTALAQSELEEREIRLAELLQRAETAEQSLAEERDVALDAQQRVELLNQQLAEIRRQLIALNEALEASESKNAVQQAQIVDLGKRLNQALATRVQELAGYRSEFFGRLREVLGNRPDIQIVGDRFVFQSEVLFATGEAVLEDEGKIQLRRLAAALQEIAREIPEDIDWVLRVDGHTDLRPIATALYPSNWELSSARATSVVKFLIDEGGIEPSRLAAAGFGQFHPLDPRLDEIGFRRNRRIEFKLTQR
ncbi:MAG: peptidoglycan -binding protein [Alphaproteobacteria bacterium]